MASASPPQPDGSLQSHSANRQRGAGRLREHRRQCHHRLRHPGLHASSARGSKIDNLVQLAHNVEIGRHTVIAARKRALPARPKVGDHCVLAGQVGMAGHLSRWPTRPPSRPSRAWAKTVKQEGTFLQGSTAFDFKQNQRAQIVFRRLPELEQRVAAAGEGQTARRKSPSFALGKRFLVSHKLQAADAFSAYYGYPKACSLELTSL